jgi:hypothetical protein
LVCGTSKSALKSFQRSAETIRRRNEIRLKRGGRFVPPGSRNQADPAIRWLEGNIPMNVLSMTSRRRVKSAKARIALAAVLLVAEITLVQAPAMAAPLSADPGTLVESIGAAAAGTITADYQARVVLHCSDNTCLAAFPALTAKQRLRLQKAICFASLASGEFVEDAYVGYGTGPTSFVLYLAQRSRIPTSSRVRQVFDEDAPFDVPKSETLVAYVDYIGAEKPYVYCSIFGQRQTFP